MKSIILNADENLLEAAEKRANAERTTLDEQFRHWLEKYAYKEEATQDAVNLVQRLQQYVRTGGQRFSRDAMNER